MPTLPLQFAVYVHDLDPFVLRFPRWGFLPEGIRWYGLSYLVAFVVGGLLVRRVLQSGRTTLRLEHLGDLVLAVAMGAVVGGRVGYCLFYDTRLLGLLPDPPYWGVLALGHGGMAFHGGFLGAIAGCWYFAWRGTLPAPVPGDGKPPAAGAAADPPPGTQPSPGPHRVRHDAAHILDLAAYGTPLGLMAGRAANFVNAELYGRPCDPAFPLAVKFPSEIKHFDEIQQLSLTDAAALLGIRQRDWREAVVQRKELVHESLQAMVETTWRRDAAGKAMVAALEPALTPRHPSQVYQGLGEGLLLFLVLLLAWMKPRKPGVVSGIFVLGYGMLRVVMEFFREPDAHIGYQWLHLTRGQWLSAGMILVGAAAIAVGLGRRTQPMGGWRR